MQLAISVLGNQSKEFATETLSALSVCQCQLIELRAASLTRLTGLFLLIDGNWNHIAKLEVMLEALARRYALQISFLRPENPNKPAAGVPYTLETISLEKKDMMFAITSFLTERGIVIEEINANRHQASYFENDVFVSKFVLLVPEQVRILSLREEFLDFCDNLNIDAILEPVKR